MDGKSVCLTRLDATRFAIFSADETVSIGIDPETAVSSDFPRATGASVFHTPLQLTKNIVDNNTAGINHIIGVDSHGLNKVILSFGFSSQYLCSVHLRCR